MSSKNYAIFWGGGGEVIKRSHWITGGRGGGQDGPKKYHIIFERSLISSFTSDLRGIGVQIKYNMTLIGEKKFFQLNEHIEP